MMKLHWINHASFIVDTQDTRLLCDPWFEGRAFNDSWALLAPTCIDDASLSQVTHLWFSHEHPDHFNLPTLKRLPAAFKERVQVFFQTTLDQRVVAALRKLGFAKVQELDQQPVALGAGVSLLGPPFLHGDSWSLVRGPDASLLNLNDCNTNRQTLDVIAAQCGPIDVLVTQFSYAAWAGNKGDEVAHRDAAAAVVDRLVEQCEVLRPRYVVLAASFVWFCHPDNFHMNAHANRIGDVVRSVRERCAAQAIVLYPGDTWVVGAEHDPGPAIQRYQSDQDRVAEHALTPARHVPEAELLAHGRDFLRRLIKHNRTLRLFLLAPTRIQVSDLGKHFILHPLRGFVEVPSGDKIPDVELGSDALDFAFRFGWGGETLIVSGRYVVPKGGNFARFHEYFNIAADNNRGHRFPGLLKTMLRTAARLFRGAPH